MFKRSFSGLLAGVCVLANAAVMPVGSVSAEEASYSMKVNVKLDGDKKEISPYMAARHSPLALTSQPR